MGFENTKQKHNYSLDQIRGNNTVILHLRVRPHTGDSVPQALSFLLGLLGLTTSTSTIH